MFINLGGLGGCAISEALSLLNLDKGRSPFDWIHSTQDFVISVFNDKNKNILSENNFSIPGKHNISNFFAAATCAKSLKVSEKNIIKAFKSFAGVQHRLEYVKNINNIKFINDSKATNIDSTKLETDTT